MLQDDEYLESRVMTASREQLHLMVVDGALRHCQRARISMEQSDREGAWQSLSEARAHVGELIAGLGDDTSDLIDRVRALFKFVYKELMFADSEQSIERIDSAISVLKIHRETWIGLIEQIAGSQEAAPAPNQRTEAVA